MKIVVGTTPVLVVIYAEGSGPTLPRPTFGRLYPT